MTWRRLGAVAREAVLLELALYRSLARWIARRPDVPRGAEPIGYARLVTPVLWLWIFGSATEVVVVEVVLRSIDAGWSEALRLPLLVVGIWGVAWMLGRMAANQMRPHFLDEDRLHVRSGARSWAVVPLDRVASARGAEHDLPGVIRSLHHDDDLLLIGIGSRANLELTLDRPTLLETSSGPVVVKRVGFWVDEPRAVTRQLDPLRRR